MSSNPTRMRATAHLLGGRVTLREVEGWPTVATAPLTLPGREGGYFVLFRFGALVEIGAEPQEAAALLERVRGLVVDPEPVRMEEVADIRIDTEGAEGPLPDGDVQLRKLDPERTQVVANILAKSAVLSHYEERVAAVFDRVETLAVQLRDGTVPASSRELLRQIGETLLIQTRMVGRVEVSEKPEITWDDPELDRLYGRLALEYELADRDRALTRKLALVSDVAGTYLELLDTRKSVRLEWYIIILIAIEIVLFIWELFGRP
jgi:uncharacterized Rmd1/YagE family protein